MRKNVLYRRKLLKSKLKAFCVVCNSFSCDVLYSILQQLLVPHIRLNQMVKTCRLLDSGVKLGNRGEHGSLYMYNYNVHLNYHHINAAHSYKHFHLALARGGKQTHSSSSTNCFTSLELNDLVPMETREFYKRARLGSPHPFFFK